MSVDNSLRVEFEERWGETADFDFGEKLRTGVHVVDKAFCQNAMASAAEIRMPLGGGTKYTFYLLLTLANYKFSQHWYYYSCIIARTKLWEMREVQ